MEEKELTYEQAMEQLEQVLRLAEAMRVCQGSGYRRVR